MQLKNSFLLAAVMFVFAGQAMASDLVIENATTHKILSFTLSDPDDASLQAYGFTIDGKLVYGFQGLMILEMIKMLSPEEQAEAKTSPETAWLLKGEPLFKKEDDQKAVFSYNKQICDQGLAAQVTAKGTTKTFCLVNDKEIADGTVWLFEEKDSFDGRR